MDDALDEMMRLTERAEAATALLPHGQALGCTELQSAWCPIHGDCLCDASGLYIEWNPLCALHADDIWTHPDQARLLTTDCEWPKCEKFAIYATRVLLPDAGDLVSVCQTHYDALWAFHGKENLAEVVHLV